MSRTEKKRFLPDAGASLAATELAKALYKIPTLLTTWTRCGKPSCRCTAGQLHGPYHALHWREGTVQRRRYVKPGEVPEVRAILSQRQAERRQQRSEHGHGLRTWRQLAQQVKTYESRLRELEDSS